jgi:hypothetical protein
VLKLNIDFRFNVLNILSLPFIGNVLNMLSITFAVEKIAYFQRASMIFVVSISCG